MGQLEQFRETAQITDVLSSARSGQSLLVTGRAGTGKSTLLRRLRTELEPSRGHIPVVAPTGIAALNVSGETLHRYFAFRQDLTPDLRRYRPPNHLKDIGMLVIDEISMVRADYFDMMSRALQRARDDDRAFGGIQVVLFGDLFQLPPVVTDRDRQFLTPYSSEHFFSAEAFRTISWKEIELTEVFRQRHQDFIDLLNRIRDGQEVEATITALNSRVLDAGLADGPKAAIVLTTTNRLAAAENQRRLHELGTLIHSSAAVVEGEVSLSDYKVDSTVEFAIGAQVMMAVNTSDYVNGTIGTITAIENTSETPRVTIQLLDSEYSGSVCVTMHKWEVWRTEEKTPRLVGSIRQLPFRLAWAVTVHRSQGQTFDNVIFNRGRGTFEAGQLYVALSRCRTLEGLYLTAPLRPRDVMVSTEVIRYFKGRALTDGGEPGVGRAYLGAVETDAGEYGRLLELSVALERSAGEMLQVSTLINPMRDMSTSPSGLSPSEVTLAPTIEELRALLAVLLDGFVVTTFGASRVLDQIGWSDSVVDEGVWIDARDFDIRPESEVLESSIQTAGDLADRARLLAGTCSDAGLGAPVSNIGLRLLAGLTLQARSGTAAINGAIEHWFASQSLESRILKIAMVASDPADIALLRGDPDFVANESEYKELASSALDRLINAAQRDNRLSETEGVRIDAFAQAFGIAYRRTDFESPESDELTLRPGLRVCLTGSPANDSDQRLKKPALREVLKHNGMTETGSVTRSGCDLLVALDASSMSGKAKQARKFGIPVVSSEEFLRRIESGEAKMNSHSSS